MILKQLLFCRWKVDGLMALMDGEHIGPFNLGNPGEFTMLELAEVGYVSSIMLICLFTISLGATCMGNLMNEYCSLRINTCIEFTCFFLFCCHFNIIAQLIAVLYSYYRCKPIVLLFLLDRTITEQFLSV